MEHAVDDPPTDHRLSALTSVLVVGLGEAVSIKNCMESKTTSGGGPVQRVKKLLYATYVVDFHNHADAVNVVRRDHLSLKGCPVCVFLYDTDRKTVYSGRQTVSFQDVGRKQAVHIPRVDPRAPTTVIVTGVSCVAADGIKVRMEKLGNVGCRVKSVQCLKPVCIAIVEFERSEDAMRVGNMERVMVPVDGKEWPVCVFVLRQLPSDPADIPNTALTAIAGMPVAASAARVGQTQALERNQAPEALEELRRMKEQMDELSRAKDQLEAQVKSQVEDKAKMQSDMSCLKDDTSSELIKLNETMTELRAGLQNHQRQCQEAHTQHEAHQRQCLEAHTQHEAHQRQCQAAHTQHEAHQRQCQAAHTQHEAHQRQCQAAHTQHQAHLRQCQEQNEVHGRLASCIAADTQNSLVRNAAAEIGTMRGQLHTVSQQVKALQGQLARLARQGVGHGVAQVRGPGLEVTNPSDSDED